MILTVKPGVLRFGPPPDVDVNRLTGPQQPPASINQSPLRPTSLSSMVSLPGSVGGMLGNSVISPESPHPVGYVGVGAGTNNSNGNVGQALPIVKTQKKRKDGNGAGAIDYESSSSNRDDVQSPAYSDISDDSTPVAEPEIIGEPSSPSSSLVVRQLLILFSYRQSSTTKAPGNYKEII